MLIIETNTNFTSYLNSLSKSSKKNYKYAQQKNQDLIYKQIQFDKALVEKFMMLWEQQIIRGRRRRWKFGIDHLIELNQLNKLIVFAALQDDEYLAVHFVHLHDNYIEAHPPMYDKAVGYERYLAKWMWFNLIKYAMDNNLPHIDMGGGDYSSWKETIKNRNEPKIEKYTKYKWLYVPEAVKKNPDNQSDYKLIRGKLMKKFIIRNDDVSFDTTLEEIKRFCEICDKYGYKIIHGIIPIGEARKITSRRLSNDQIRALSNKLFSENREVFEYLKQRNDYIGVHGLWHTHKPGYDEIKAGKSILEGLGFQPEYFVAPFNEGSYPDNFAGLKTVTLSMKGGDRLEDFLEKGVPESEIMYLHSWRFDNNWYNFDQLEECLKRLSTQE